MDITQIFATDKEKEEKGTWIRLSTDLEILVARLDNKHYRRYIAKQLEAYPTIRGRVQVEDDVVADIVTRACATHILLGWRGNMTETLDDGSVVDLTYTSDEAYRMFIAYPDFHDHVIKLAGNMENYREVRIKDAVGN